VYRRDVFAVAATVLALLGFPNSAAATTVSVSKRYVALGDSYASGPGIPVQRADPVGCQRSTHNYPARLAAALGISNYTDVSCGGARTDNMTVSQPVRLGPHPPQFNALTPDTDLVTVTIGGNDINIGDLWLTCARLGATDPLGNPCERQAIADGTDLYTKRIAAAAPKVARVLEGIRAHSPHARVLVVGYLRVLPPAGEPVRPSRSPAGMCRMWMAWSSGSTPCWPTRPATTARCSLIPTRAHWATTPANSPQ
jgi:lysophospholipase L1-like esterase